MKAQLIPGHTLKFEGAPFILNTQKKPIRITSNWGGGSGVGRALCSCGTYSDELPSAMQRKQWHRDHKAEIAAGV